jgi:hypothetical protein
MLTLRHRVTFEHALLKATNCAPVPEQQIPHTAPSVHKHTVWVFVKIYGDLNNDGYLQNYVGDQLDPVFLKNRLADYLTSEYEGTTFRHTSGPTFSPGSGRGRIQSDHVDPTYFYIAERIGSWIIELVKTDLDVEVVGNDEISASVGLLYVEEENGREPKLVAVNGT